MAKEVRQEHIGHIATDVLNNMTKNNPLIPKRLEQIIKSTPSCLSVLAEVEHEDGEALRLVRVVLEPFNDEGEF